MKRKTDPRHLKRVETVKEIFQTIFQKKYRTKKSSDAAKIIKKQEIIDNLIAKHAPSWPIDQISAMDLAILRVAIWELIIKESHQPPKVIIDEAIEIAKEFGNDSSPSFVNGVLGTILKKRKENHA